MSDVEHFYSRLLTFIRQEQEQVESRLVSGSCGSFESYRVECKTLMVLRLIEHQAHHIYKTLLGVDDDGTDSPP